MCHAASLPPMPGLFMAHASLAKGDKYAGEVSETREMGEMGEMGEVGEK